MATSLIQLYNRTRYILFHEGLSKFLKQGFTFARNSVYAHGIYLAYEFPISPTNIESKNICYVQKVISDINEYNRLIDEGYNFKNKNFSTLIEKGAIAFCLFAQQDLIYTHWVATTELAKRVFDPIPFKVYFDKDEVCAGGSFTEPEFRGKGLHTYVFSLSINYLAQKGVKKYKYSLKKGNVASQRTGDKFNPKLISQWQHIRILWWESWKELALKETE